MNTQRYLTKRKLVIHNAHHIHYELHYKKKGLHYMRLSHSSHQRFAMKQILISYINGLNAGKKHIHQNWQLAIFTCCAFYRCKRWKQSRHWIHPKQLRQTGKFINIGSFLSVISISTQLVGLKISLHLCRASPEIVWLKRKGKMADDNVGAAKSHKMALDKGKAVTWSHWV